MRENTRHGLPLAVLAAVVVLALLANRYLHRPLNRDAAAPSPITVVRAAPAQAAGAPASFSQDQLTLALLGTSLGPGPADKSAVIAITGGAPRAYRVGDRIAPGTNLQSIAPDHVDILENGVARRLYLSAAASPPPVRHDSPKLHALFASLHRHGRLRAGSRTTFHSDDTPEQQVNNRRELQ